MGARDDEYDYLFKGIIVARSFVSITESYNCS